MHQQLKEYAFMVVTISKLFLPLDFLFQKACLTKCVNKTDLLAQFIITKLARTKNFDSIRPQNSRVVLVDKIEISAKLCINLDDYRIKQGHFEVILGPTENQENLAI